MQNKMLKMWMTGLMVSASLCAGAQKPTEDVEVKSGSELAESGTAINRESLPEGILSYVATDSIVTLQVASGSYCFSFVKGDETRISSVSPKHTFVLSVVDSNTLRIIANNNLNLDVFRLNGAHAGCIRVKEGNSLHPANFKHGRTPEVFVVAGKKIMI